MPRGDFDLSLIGIGENGHLAFNDPPADFAAEVPERFTAVANDLLWECFGRHRR